MKVTKSLQEVWDWKEKVYEETKGLSVEETARKIQRDADEICKKYGLKLKTLHPLEKQATKQLCYLGHSDVTTTLRYYVDACLCVARRQVFPEDLEEAAEMLEEKKLNLIAQEII